MQNGKRNEWTAYLEKKQSEAEEVRRGAHVEQRGKLLQFRNKSQAQHATRIVLNASMREDIARAERVVVATRKQLERMASEFEPASSQLSVARMQILNLERLVGLLARDGEQK